MGTFKEGHSIAQVLSALSVVVILAAFAVPALGETFSELHVEGNLQVDGYLAIGTTNPGPHKLAVEGSIGAREFVITDAPWADFVFKEGYKTLPLNDLESFIKEHGRLPDIPTAKEVAAHGVNVGKTHAKLLQKIEELTLHLIEMKKENEELRTRIGALEKNGRP